MKGGWRQRVSDRIIFYTVLLLALAMFPCVSAASDPAAQAQVINLYIQYDRVLVESAILFDSPQTIDFSVDLPYDARSISEEIDDERGNTELIGTGLVFHMENNRRAEYTFITEDLIEDNSLVASLAIPFDTANVKVKLTLPEGATLRAPVKKRSVAASSVYPRPANLETDGIATTIVWEFQDVKQGDDLTFYVLYDAPFNRWGWVIAGVLILLVLLLVIGGVFLWSRYRGQKPKLDREPITVDSGIEKHLKEDEEQIVNILKMKEGSCEQGTLRVATGFSKAKLSGLLKEMEQRKLVHKEKRGKKNLVFLKR